MNDWPWINQNRFWWIRPVSGILKRLHSNESYYIISPHTIDRIAPFAGSSKSRAESSIMKLQWKGGNGMNEWNIVVFFLYISRTILKQWQSVEMKKISFSQFSSKGSREYKSLRSITFFESDRFATIFCHFTVKVLNLDYKNTKKFHFSIKLSYKNAKNLHLNNAE